ncbi:50S ribosomal protein L25/general stress protein Ctc [Coxiella endosymbiont of Amblyomma sculptum]|uniref:50S ribosomal protein L25/general stress protein Ctc n=1 Tax=Coxiella endosymbiont of Amblyomma sculptum TaxID=2487929 RepID=UPI00132EB44B|nr:50S ribosomal protein L25/general stress protein Ctc [Coxiella endosymbiont of Amblyomma sculptum]QHG92241.1 50S ribosomal protein L25/general stress protein Ctc [Coxiella endosymbiont of Amblyomma sculptum]
MTAGDFEFEAELRKEIGTKSARRIRRLCNKVLGTVYGAGKVPQSVSLLQKDVLKAFASESVFSSVLVLKINGKKQRVILKDLQRHHTKPKILHIDFQRIRASEKIVVRVPLHIIGKEKCIGVRAGGIVSYFHTDVEIRCFPADLPAYVGMDISQLNLDKSLHFSDLELPFGVELATTVKGAKDWPVVGVHLPRVSKDDIAAEIHENSDLSDKSEIASSSSSKELK